MNLFNILPGLRLKTMNQLNSPLKDFLKHRIWGNKQLHYSFLIASESQTMHACMAKEVILVLPPTSNFTNLKVFVLLCSEETVSQLEINMLFQEVE